ncbi:protein-tyrosine-phosphatase [Philodulcilactobacillus myokoensis]|uniref:protein-tyrosine-phosphatase n=1 Tax=Philodulcilactobacillus myokoensis TaxID=2929573 RepID=A0A9W6B2J0_9LACO|nr:low molecular weight protein-tyrosine-phosphatase [Philodulcilactobacillus myokoensis]GLB47218.1 protein-tyrosine-phosphatase [Philodulcilactobacillus myokoensis]
MKHVLFVCLGNVCRSAMAEAIFKRIVKEKHLQDRIQIKSAGTSDEEQGHYPLPEVRSVLRQHGLDPSKLHAKQITIQDINWADYIIGMDHQNILNLKRITPANQQSKIHLCLNINPKLRNQEIPDPWYTRRFAFTYDVLNQNLPLWLNYIVQN